MTDYGHELSFGVFITPLAAQPQEVVTLARRAEASGLDLVTFQDHPYQPRFLDTWTLLSFVAAATERVHLSGYVLNLPSRPPAVLARAAASLDLLSSGRFELGIGPGDTFASDAVAANGGARRTAGEAVTALGEAIDIIRGMWDTSTPEPLTAGGRLYRVDGVGRGPAPLHPIGIWVPAWGRLMRQLVGTKADGWIAGGAWLSEDRQITEGNLAVDEAAAAFGRDPRQIRRIWDFEGTLDNHGRGGLRSTPTAWTGRLTELAIEHGMGSFIVISNDPFTIERFGKEIAPAVRDAVARERSAAHV